MKEKTHRILLAEDDPNFGTVMHDYLDINDYEVTLCRDGKEAQQAFDKDYFDLCILDIMMPFMDGFALAKYIRSKNKEIPIIFLTAKSLKTDMLEGYKIGADDYITKPFDSEILLMKIKAILNRSKEDDSGKPMQFKIGLMNYNHKLRTLTAGENTYRLSPKEGELLHMLCLRMNDLLKRETALRKIWGDDNYFTARSMDVFVAKLRKYLSYDPEVVLENIHGSGFRLIVNKS
ncbi:MAG: response regulator transcription factor [Bacteroidia bacterium]|nr:response regulator transcription factor [Bacteroidia bacterium]MCZ2277060.1 response regulator transcription factor [Bacteroidia bacterium]